MDIRGNGGVEAMGEIAEGARGVCTADSMVESMRSTFGLSEPFLVVENLSCGMKCWRSFACLKPFNQLPLSTSQSPQWLAHVLANKSALFRIIPMSRGWSGRWPFLTQLKRALSTLGCLVARLAGALVRSRLRNLSFWRSTFDIVL